jgi:predicted RNase H-like nuclease (RuvC/YqgF family)
MKPKEIIQATGLAPKSVYAVLYKLCDSHEVAKEDDGVYIIQPTTQQAANNTTEKMLEKRITALDEVIEKQRKEIDKYDGWCLEWRDKYHELNTKHNNLMAYYQAVNAYLEGRLQEATKELYEKSKA